MRRRIHRHCHGIRHCLGRKSIAEMIVAFEGNWYIMSTWDAKMRKAYIYAYCGDGTVNTQKRVFKSIPLRPIAAIGVNYLTYAHSAVAICHRACRWLSRFISELIALKLRDQLRVIQQA